MKLKLAIYALAAASAFLGTLLVLMAVTDGRDTRTPWPTACAAGGCAYVTATPPSTWLPATGTAWANYQLAVYATHAAHAAATAPAAAVQATD